MAEVRAAKHLGQHFLADDHVIGDMLSAIYPQPDERIIEIGPGLGALTLPVLAKAGALTAIEFDSRVLAPLARKAAAVGKLNLIEADVLTVDFADLGLATPLRIIGNLPYNLSSPILFHCLAQRQHIQDMHFMLQKEVVERIVAQPDNKDYGRLSLMLQQYLLTESLFDIPPEAFDPPPKVDSAVVRLVPRAAPQWAVQSPAHFALVVKTAFAQRRKMLRKSLSHWFSSEALQQLDIDPTLRPENLDGAGFARLADALLAKEAQND